MSTLNLSTTPVTSRRLQQSAEVHLPEFYAGNNIFLIALTMFIFIYLFLIKEKKNLLVKYSVCVAWLMSTRLFTERVGPTLYCIDLTFY